MAQSRESGQSHRDHNVEESRRFVPPPRQIRSGRNARGLRPPEPQGGGQMKFHLYYSLYTSIQTITDLH